MLKHTFTILPNVSNKKEKMIWNNAETWDDFLSLKKIKGISSKRKLFFDRQLKRAKAELDIRNSRYFSSILSSKDMWRLYDEFKEETLFLDIETSRYYGDVTVLGLYNGDRFYAMLQGKNLDRERFKNIIDNHRLLVTFNGSSFDIPVLERFFRMKIDIPHIDLRHLCARIGLTGGLKSIEAQIGIARDNDVVEMKGDSAVSLWENFLITRDESLLRKLLKYNKEDVVNLKEIADYAVNIMRAKVKKYK